MNASFYTASRGVMTQQEKMGVIANNIANVNTYGYKQKSAQFQDLMHYNMRAAEGERTNLTTGTGTKLLFTNTDYSQSGFGAGIGIYDFAISGQGFFMLRNPANNEISYTRNGHFSLSLRGDTMYLVTDSNKLVLDANQNPIAVVDGRLQAAPAIYAFPNTDGMESIGNNEYAPIPKNGNPFLNPEATLVDGVLELSNVEMAKEMANTVESSRAYSYVMKMMMTSDEVEQTINSLRA